ncbi:hypothetical protein NSK_004177 [Nannochloropsis salina CCMP1776]|uniref:Uncharacterized protein n=1 Tax=Nannochloropsis salina CCMP1776 TaxID=1027361 RepID=A0A4D9D3W3_9STRA|nr:hypothetical protein NSK_004177 [Nannochloropsis salina CCMP1776]|eukprot:TFJ84713.1 hypothetical protein NSK_004177 [Nannochloropsis salina CCMP1776]
MSRTQRAFYSLGRFSAARIGLVFALCTFVSLILGLGMLTVVVETSPQEHCIDFVLKHSEEVMGDDNGKTSTPFLKEVEKVPNLLATVLRAVTAFYSKKRKRELKAV